MALFFLVAVMVASDVDVVVLMSFNFFSCVLVLSRGFSVEASMLVFNRLAAFIDVVRMCAMFS